MTTQLELYNDALIEIGERTLSSLSENREPRRVLDAVYSNVVAECLEAGQWTFAVRTIQIDADPNLTTDFGYNNVFTKPDDWVRTIGLSDSEYVDLPLNSYKDEGGYWLADVDPLYVSYVSNDTSYGLNLGLWPASFSKYVVLSLAQAICRRITSNKADSEAIEKSQTKAKRDALNKDSFNKSVKFAPTGSWVNARSGGGTRERGKLNRLIG